MRKTYLPQGPQSASGPGAQGTKGMALPIENHETNCRKHTETHRTTLEIKKKQENYIYICIVVECCRTSMQIPTSMSRITHTMQIASIDIIQTMQKYTKTPQ